MIWRAGVLLIAVLCAPAMAGQYTHDRIIGFSEDGRHFAFKTYGLQRGSGLPFASVFVVDLTRNAWLPGTPLRAGRDEAAMPEVEAAPFAALRAVRAEVMQAAQPVLRDLSIHRPATVLYAAGIGQAHAAGAQTRIAIPHPDDPTAPPWGEFTLRLTPIQVPAAATFCAHPDALRGYWLEMQWPDGTTQVVHADTRIPASRGCAQAYRLDAVVSAGYPQPGAPMVALISVWRQGFEGLERHVIAAPLPAFGDGDGRDTARQAADGQSLDAVLGSFLDGFSRADVDALNANLPARQQADAGAVRWPDADWSAVARAVEVFAAQDGFAPHGRMMLRAQPMELAPAGAGGQVALTLIRLQAFNLGQARRDDLRGLLGEDVVAPAAQFGAGPDVEWRFVMRPVQGMRADIVAAGWREIDARADVDCAPASCRSADLLDGDALGLACSNAAAVSGAVSGRGAATRLGQMMRGVDDAAPGTDWLVEHGLWQADATRIMALDGSRITGCWLTLHGPQ